MLILIDVRPEVALLAEAMEKKLKKNDHKGDWKGLSREDSKWFLERLDDEVVELKEAVTSNNPVDIMYEAADVANFAMMIMDIFSRGEKGNGTQNNGVERADESGVPGQIRKEGLKG